MVKNHQPTERDAIAKTIVGHAPRTGANASGTGLLGLQALLEQARRPTWRLWAKDAAIEKKDVLKARNYSWSPGVSGRPKCWYRDVANADKAAEVSWLRQSVMGPQAVWALRITAKDRYPIGAGFGVNLSVSSWNALRIALEGAGAAQ